MDEYKKYLTAPIRRDRTPLQDLLPLNQPLRVLIDPSDICNFRCDFCFQSKVNFHGEIMTMDTFNKIIGQLEEFEEPINVVHLYGLGEPLLNKQIPLFVQSLKRNKVAKEVAITTNGSLLTHNLSSALVQSGLDRLSISLNGITDEQLRKTVGVAVSFDQIYQEIQYFYSIRRQCHLHVKINGDYFSEDEKKRFVELFKDITDSINIDNVVNVWPGIEITNKHQRMYDYNLEQLNKRDTNRRMVCPLMFYEIHIHSDGKVSPCAVDYNFKEQNLGNIYDASIRQIWKSEQLRRIQIQSLEGAECEYEMCNECIYPDCAATVNITPFRDSLLEKYR